MQISNSKINSFSGLDKEASELALKIIQLGGYDVRIETSFVMPPHTLGLSSPQALISTALPDTHSVVSAKLKVYGVIRYWDIFCKYPIYDWFDKELTIHHSDMMTALRQMIYVIEQHNASSMELYSQYSYDARIKRLEEKGNVNSSNPTC